MARPLGWSVAAIAAVLASTGASVLALPAVPVPPENPMTEPKRVLGKILFWDEQLSPSLNMSCGTCHQPGIGGSDPRLAVNPGPDNLVSTPDDRVTSFGVIRSDASNEYIIDPVFGLNRQATPRSANSTNPSGTARSPSPTCACLSRRSSAGRAAPSRLPRAALARAGSTTACASSAWPRWPSKPP